jgi:hypothetical protein
MTAVLPCDCAPRVASGPLRFAGPNLAWAGLSLATLILAGCGQGPDRVEAPDWDPPAMAERIVADLDKNGDAQIDAEELAAAPGLKSGVRFIDVNKDDRVTGEELEARFERYREARIGLRSPGFRLVYKGRPVADAEVVFTPEPFLEGVIETARGTTDAQGIVTPQAEGQDLLGMRVGYYRVQVTSPRTRIPEKYNGSATTLGADVSLGEDEASYGLVNLQLTD